MINMNQSNKRYLTEEEKQKQKEERFKKIYYPMVFKIIHRTTAINTVLFSVINAVWSMLALSIMISNSSNTEITVGMTASIILFCIVLLLVILLQILDWLANDETREALRYYYWDMAYTEHRIWANLYWVNVGIITVLVTIASLLMINIYI